MPASGTQYANKLVSYGKALFSGLFSPNAATGNAQQLPHDACLGYFCTGATGTGDVADLTFVIAGATVQLIADYLVPANKKIYITELEVYTSTAVTGGTSGTVSLTIQDSAATAIATYTQTALTTLGTYIALPVGGSLPTGVTDSTTLPMGAATANGKGIQAVIATNSTAGVVRVRIRYFFGS